MDNGKITFKVARVRKISIPVLGEEAYINLRYLDGRKAGYITLEGRHVPANLERAVRVVIYVLPELDTTEKAML